MDSVLKGPCIRISDILNYSEEDQAGDDEGGGSQVSAGDSCLAETTVEEVLVKICSCTLYAYIVYKFISRFPSTMML